MQSLCGSSTSALVPCVCTTILPAAAGFPLWIQLWGLAFGNDVPAIRVVQTTVLWHWKAPFFRSCRALSGCMRPFAKHIHGVLTDTQLVVSFAKEPRWQSFPRYIPAQFWLNRCKLAIMFWFVCTLRVYSRCLRFQVGSLFNWNTVEFAVLWSTMHSKGSRCLLGAYCWWPLQALVLYIPILIVAISQSVSVCPFADMSSVCFRAMASIKILLWEGSHPRFAAWCAVTVIRRQCS